MSPLSHLVLFTLVQTGAYGAHETAGGTRQRSHDGADGHHTKAACTDGAISDGLDYHECPAWVARGYCTRSSAHCSYMKTVCLKSCCEADPSFLAHSSCQASEPKKEHELTELEKGAIAGGVVGAAAIVTAATVGAEAAKGNLPHQKGNLPHQKGNLPHQGQEAEEEDEEEEPKKTPATGITIEEPPKTPAAGITIEESPKTPAARKAPQIRARKAGDVEKDDVSESGKLWGLDWYFWLLIAFGILLLVSGVSVLIGMCVKGKKKKAGKRGIRAAKVAPEQQVATQPEAQPLVQFQPVQMQPVQMQPVQTYSMPLAAYQYAAPAAPVQVVENSRFVEVAQPLPNYQYTAPAQVTPVTYVQGAAGSVTIPAQAVMAYQQPMVVAGAY